MTKRHTLPAAVLGALLLAACDSSTGPDLEPCDAVLLQFAPVAGDTVTTATGLRFQEIEQGAGTPAENLTDVRVHYTGYLVGGTRFGSSCINQETFDFRLGSGAAIPGFDEGIVGMRVGGVRRLIIPPALGYGNVPNGPIPANSTLIFDVELVGAG